MINVTKTYLPPLEQYTAYLERIWETHHITNNGPLLKELECKLQQYLQTPYLCYVSNGTIALQLALKALKITGEVITTPFSYVATTTAILWEQCQPAFVDIEEQTFCLNPELIEAAITERTQAILATHVYGYPCQVEQIARIARQHKLKVIYDAAHCFGVQLDGRSLLNYGDASTLSFHATKLFHTAEGGAVVTGDADLARALWLSQKFGHIGEEEYVSIGINAKNSELHAAMGLCVLPEVPNIIAGLKQRSDLYDALLADTPLIFPTRQANVTYNYSYYPVIFESYEQMMHVREMLMAQEIMPRRYFYPSLNTLPYLPPPAQQCPVSERVAERVLCLPLYYTLEETQIENIAHIVKQGMLS